MKHYTKQLCLFQTLFFYFIFILWGRHLCQSKLLVFATDRLIMLLQALQHGKDPYRDRPVSVYLKLVSTVSLRLLK